MSEIDVNMLKQEILSLLVSAKDGLSERELLKDYRSFNSNKELPYRVLGYPSLTALLRSWPDICRVQQQGNSGALRILAVEEESTKHILSMVRGQRHSKSRGSHRCPRNRGQDRNGNRKGGRNNRAAQFSYSTFNSNNNQFRGRGRGTSSGCITYSEKRSERSIAPFLSATEQSHQKFRGKSNMSVLPRCVKQQQSRSYATDSSQPRMFFSVSRSSTNSNVVNNRCVVNNSASLEITVTNNASHVTDYVLNDDEEQSDDQDDKEEEVIDNLHTLLAEYPHGIRLLVLDELYQKKFGNRLLAELKIANILLIQDVVDDFACISRHGEENGSCDHIITLKDPAQIAQSKYHLLQQITDSGIVPETFRFASNLFSYINDSRFQGFISDIDQHEHCLHVQPVRYQGHIETLMEELNSYYSSAISNSLIVKNIETGLSCVTKYDGVYHRAFIKETDLYKCVIIYVDYGTAQEVNKNEQEFKYLLEHFAELPSMAIACRLDNISFIPDDNNLSPNVYNQLYTLCKDGPFFIEPTGYMNELLTIRVLDADMQCLNDIVVELKLAVKITTSLSHSPQGNYEYEHENTPKPVELSFDFSDNAAKCPLPDSDPSTPENDMADPYFKLPKNCPSQSLINRSSDDCQCKLIQIDENNSFYLIRQNDKPYIPCFNLAHLLELPEQDILSETLLSRIRISQKTEFCLLFDSLEETNSKDCLHREQNFIFLFDLTSVLKYIKRLNQPHNNILIEILHQQIDASNEPLYWKNPRDYYKPSSYVEQRSTVPTSNSIDIKRYNELLDRRNILCNMLRTNHVTECTLELTLIENELEQLVQKMRIGATPQNNSNVSSTPTSFTKSINTDQQYSIMNKIDKLKDLMERCKKLINAILVFYDFIPIDDNVTKYIEGSLQFLNLGKSSLNDDQLYKQYADLLHNLTFIVDDLQQKFPTSVSCDQC